MFGVAGHEGRVGMSGLGIRSSEIGVDECRRWRECEFELPFSQRKDKKQKQNMQNRILRMWSESHREREGFVSEQ